MDIVNRDSSCKYQSLVSVAVTDIGKIRVSSLREIREKSWNFQIPFLNQEKERDFIKNQEKQIREFRYGIYLFI